jgi:hypothetical protein
VGSWNLHRIGEEPNLVVSACGDIYVSAFGLRKLDGLRNGTCQYQVLQKEHKDGPRGWC